MSIETKHFDNLNGNEVTAYILNNGKGLEAEILNLGGIIRRLVFDGTDVVLGRDRAEHYYGNDTYFGALIGRNSNRIEGCKFSLNNKVYELAKNDHGRDNNLHGGIHGFDSKIWDAEVVDGDEPSLILSAFSPDGEEGFPGNVEIKVTYTLTKENSLKIHYMGTTDADTILNMTNHSYFNLNGHSSGDVKNHTLQMNCSFYTPNNEACLPDGSVIRIKGTPFDFTSEKKVGTDLECDDYQIKTFDGYDHNFVIDGTGFRKFATVKGDITRITMECYTDLPGVQLYTGNYVTADVPCKNGEEYKPYQGLCLETQFFPNAINCTHFPSPVLKKGEEYDTVTEYKFSSGK